MHGILEEKILEFKLAFDMLKLNNFLIATSV